MTNHRANSALLVVEVEPTRPASKGRSSRTDLNPETEPRASAAAHVQCSDASASSN